MLCDAFFDELMTLDDMRGLDEPDAEKKPENDLGRFQFAEAAFLHEMLHVIEYDVNDEECKRRLRPAAHVWRELTSTTCQMLMNTRSS